MLAIPIALLTPPSRCAFARSLREVSPRPTRFLSCQYHYPINPLDATLMDLPASVANKRLTSKLTPLNATLTKNWGAHLSTFTPSDVPTNLRTAPFSFPTLTNAPSRKPFPFTPLQMPGGMGLPMFQLSKRSSLRCTPFLFNYLRTLLLLMGRGGTPESARRTLDLRPYWPKDVAPR
jgi:hypothetical protein